jgi:hypothetical protein
MVQHDHARTLRVHAVSASNPVNTTTTIGQAGSAPQLPKYHEIAANKEAIDTIGVAPDHFAPLTAADLSAGRDPGIAAARQLLL